MIILALLVAAVVIPNSVAAQNLLTNGRFDTNLAGWTSDFGSDIAWSSQDAHSSASSGSMSIKPFNAGSLYAFQTIAVTPGATYTISGSINDQVLTPDSYAFVLGVWIDGAGTELPPPATRLRFDATRTSLWVKGTATGTAPSGAARMQVLVSVIAYQPTTTDFALFDDLAVTRSTPAPTATFTANPPLIAAGDASTLSWATGNATTVSIDHGIGAKPLAGAVPVTPAQTTTYTLTAIGDGGTKTATATVTIAPAPTIVFIATPPSTFPGGTVRLEWQVFDATLVVLDPALGAQPFTGSLVVTPKMTTVYTLTATGAGGTRVMPLTVTVSGRRRAAGR